MRRPSTSVIHRQRKDFIFRLLGLFSITSIFIFLIVLLFSITKNGYNAFTHTKILFFIKINTKEVNALSNAQRHEKIRQILRLTVNREFPRYKNLSILSYTANYELKKIISSTTEDKIYEVWLPTSNEIDDLIKKRASKSDYVITTNYQRLITRLREQKRIKVFFNTNIFSKGDSYTAENAGILSAAIGSLLTVVIAVIPAIIIGIAAGVFLQEIMRKNFLCEVMINNLSATPPIIFGIIALTIFIQFCGIPRSSALVGGLTLLLIMLPIVTIVTREAVHNVPQSIKYAALALGASKIQVILHHTLPAAFVGIVTGIMMGIARIISEASPLLMVGMMAFITDIPQNIFSATTTLPIQIYTWLNNPDPHFQEVASVAVFVLLLLLLLLNMIILLIRKKIL